MENNIREITQCLTEVVEPQRRVSESEPINQPKQVDESKEAERIMVRTAIDNIPQYDVQIGQQHPLKILLAEDSIVNLKIALWFLKKLGYHADIAFNGIEAIDALNRQSYDVILMDAEMPEMDGREATTKIRKDFPADQQPHIIAMTANAMQGDREQFLSIGMDDYVTKPLKLEEVVRVLLASNSLDAMQGRTSADSNNEKQILRVA